ncbi:hypothetical protein PPACK8108_LOCUS22669 [Phakopsora pachyrhizi]|uniref:FAS1 domain-containing protein n=1 Tax=Phakopsora pachyrhizi TaxID=170000 RepID=A0AAV0BME2_PHAPC|nr:hypothetical protein PPACK8108_LOCUS22669 [Phakopsora pachyrhizi]
MSDRLFYPRRVVVYSSSININLIIIITIIIITITINSVSTSHHSFNQLILSSIKSQPSTQSVSLIDILSNSTQHTKLLLLIQRSRLIPTINLLKNSTLLAPTDDAIDRYLGNLPPTLDPSPLSINPELDDSLIYRSDDNLMSHSRQTILYHLLNLSLSLSSISSTVPQPFETLLHPPSENSDSGLLAGHGQRINFINLNGQIHAGVNGSGLGGVQLPSGDRFLWADNGLLIPIDDVLTPPPSVAQIIRTDPRLSIYRSILPDKFIGSLHSMPHLTLFSPDNQAWGSLGPIEMEYLRSSYGAEDSIKLFQKFTSQNVLGEHQIGYLDRLQDALRNRTEPTDLLLSTIDGQPIQIRLDQGSGPGGGSGKLLVNGSEILQSDILASNGVLHIVPKLLLPPDGNPISMNAEKYLVALNCSKFVSLFRSANLSTTYLTNSSSQSPSLTILAPNDEAVGHFEKTFNLFSSNDSAESLKRLLSYHVIRGKYLIDSLDDGMLLSTELLLGDGSNSELRQRMPVSVSSSDSTSSPSFQWSSSGKNQSLIVGFGGANFLGVKPVEIGNTVIYIVSQMIEPPSDLLRVALSDIRLSTCVASIFSVKLEEEFKSLSAITFLVPTNDAFAELGLIMDYLLLERSREDLIKVLRYHTLTEPIYLGDLKIGHNKRYPTLEGGEIYIDKLGTGPRNVTIHGPTLTGVPLNGETRDSEVVNEKDLLVENGSIEIIDQVELPTDVEITVKKLILGAKASTMLELIETSNLSWVLNSDLKDGRFENSTHDNSRNYQSSSRGFQRSFSILCPTDEAFTKINLTYYLEDRIRLQELVLQHIIPTDPSSFDQNDGNQDEVVEPFRPLYIGDGKVYSTLLSSAEGGPSGYGEVSFRPIEPSSASRKSLKIFKSNGNKGDDDNGGGDDFGSRKKPKWMIGIKGARGSYKDGSRHYSSRIINYGRASPRLILGLQSGRIITIGGGILSLDSVLEPYKPNAWNIWGRYLVGCGFLFLLILLAGAAGYKIYSRRKFVPILLFKKRTC